MELSSKPTASADVRFTVVAIDGPAGSGKSTIARQLAKAVGLEYLDTGAMYRAVTFAVLEKKVSPDNSEAVTAIAQKVKILLEPNGVVTVDGVDATTEIRGDAVSSAVSIVAANPQVRAELVAQQREWVRHHCGGILDGRDIGTVVFPDAVLKIYLTAKPEVRAARRTGESADAQYEKVVADLTRRDLLDSEREHDPLTQAKGALVVDTSDMTIDQVVDELISQLNQARKRREATHGQQQQSQQ